MIEFQAFILGVIQGLTEFLPVSSSAHLILTPYLFHWKDPGLAFDVALHMGTLTAIVIYYSQDWIQLVRTLFGKKYKTPTVDFKILVLGTIPAAVLGLLFQDIIEEHLRAPWLVACMLIFFAGLLWYFDNKGSKKKHIKDLSIKAALFIGFAQALALMPGVSRAGITITAALALGFSRTAGAKFSFMLSAPIIAGAGILKMPEILKVLESGGPEAISMAYGFMSSLIFGLLAVGVVNYLARHKTMRVFVFYRIALGLLILGISLS